MTACQYAYVDWYTAQKAKKIEAYCAKWKNKCMVEITPEYLVVEDAFALPALKLAFVDEITSHHVLAE